MYKRRALVPRSIYAAQEPLARRAAHFYVHIDGGCGIGRQSCATGQWRENSTGDCAPFVFRPVRWGRNSAAIGMYNRMLQGFTAELQVLPSYPARNVSLVVHDRYLQT
jgi:hypothetical protein